MLITLCEETKNILKNEENIINIDGDVIVVGNIHGSFHDLLRILKFVEADNSKVVFLGDYVDRGCFSLECITLLFSLKLLNPDRYFLLRGNHEFDDMCTCYGFKKEILNYHNPKTIEFNTNHFTPKSLKNRNLTDEKQDTGKICSTFPDDEPIIQDEDANNYFNNHININCYKYTEKLSQSIMDTFSYLPICSIINKTSFCLHGGITPLLEKVDGIKRSIQRPIIDFDQCPLLTDILWGDPSPDSNRRFIDNPRGRGQIFNGPVLINFLKENNFKRLIRGHECVNGIKTLFNNKCITVFSASSYSFDMSNSSGILKLFENNDNVEPIIFEPLHRLKKCDTCYYRVQAFYNNQVCISIRQCKSGFLSLYKFGKEKHISRHSSMDMPENAKKRNSNIRLPLNNKLPQLRSGKRKSVSNSNLKAVPTAPKILAPKMIYQNNSLFLQNAKNNCVDEKLNMEDDVDQNNFV